MQAESEGKIRHALISFSEGVSVAGTEQEEITWFREGSGHRGSSGAQPAHTLVCDGLRHIARPYMRNEQIRNTLQATAYWLYCSTLPMRRPEQSHLPTKPPECPARFGFHRTVETPSLRTRRHRRRAAKNRPGHGLLAHRRTDRRSTQAARSGTKHQRRSQSTIRSGSSRGRMADCAPKIGSTHWLGRAICAEQRLF